MSAYTTTTETDPTAGFIGLRNISSSFINYTMLDFDGDGVDGTEEELYRDTSQKDKRSMGRGNSIIIPEMSWFL